MNTIEKRQRIEQLQDELKRLQEQVGQEERRCRHTRWSDTTYDPIETPRMEFRGYRGQGSDPEPVYERSGTDQKPRWKRVCLDCGKVQFTENRKTTQTAPDFG